MSATKWFFGLALAGLVAAAAACSESLDHDEVCEKYCAKFNQCYSQTPSFCVCDYMPIDECDNEQEILEVLDECSDGDCTTLQSCLTQMPNCDHSSGSGLGDRRPRLPFLPGRGGDVIAQPVPTDPTP